MTQFDDQTRSRIARIEALTLEIAASNLRHDRVLNHHDDEFQRVNARLDRIDLQQERNAQVIANTDLLQERNAQMIANLAVQQNLNQEAIANLMASIQELRHMVADYIQRRMQL